MKYFYNKIFFYIMVIGLYEIIGNNIYMIFFIKRDRPSQKAQWTLTSKLLLWHIGFKVTTTFFCHLAAAASILSNSGGFILQLTNIRIARDIYYVVSYCFVINLQTFYTNPKFCCSFALGVSLLPCRVVDTCQ